MLTVKIIQHCIMVRTKHVEMKNLDNHLTAKVPQRNKKSITIPQAVK